MAENGQLKCLKYTTENGCPWDEYTYANAIANGHFECFKYAHENGCPCDKLLYAVAAQESFVRCLKYFEGNEDTLEDWMKKFTNGVMDIEINRTIDDCNEYFKGYEECIKYIRDNII